MSEGLIKFELDGEQVELYFGMKAILLFSEKLSKHVTDNGFVDDKGQPDFLQADRFLTFAYIIFGGMCNSADRKELPYPVFTEAYDLTEKINHDPVLTKRIYDFWNNCKASKSLKEAALKVTTKSTVKTEKKKKAV
jgi:hypothetical protein